MVSAIQLQKNTYGDMFTYVYYIHALVHIHILHGSVG